MMEKTIKTLNYLHQEGSKEYQNRVPLATQENIKDVGNAILEFETVSNEFLSNLINKIALTEVMSANPKSVFGEFVGQDLLYGDTIESIFVSMTKSEGFKGDNLKDGDSIDPFKVKKPAIEVAYHRVDRKVYYQVTVQEVNIRRAFNNAGAFNSFVSELITSLSKSVERDLYVDGLELLDRDGKDGKSNIYGKIDELGEFEEAKEMATAINTAVKAHTTYMPFIRTEFNALGLETNTPKEDIVVFIRADIKNLIDTEVLSNIFNPSKLGSGVRYIEIDEFIDGEQVVSILDRTGIKIHHALLKTTSQDNAVGLYTNYFSHVHRLVSYDPFANAVKITAKLV